MIARSLFPIGNAEVLCFLYKLDFPNGKSYIGVTTTMLCERINKHKTASSLVGHGIRCHGILKDRILVVGERQYILSLEKKAISKYKTLAPNGYNLSQGGEGFSSEDVKSLWNNPKIRERWIQNISISQKRRYQSREQYEKQLKILARARKKRWSTKAQRKHQSERRKQELQSEKKRAQFLLIQAKGRASRWGGSK